MNKHANKGLFCSKAAFTLIELLVVVLIIGILAAVAMPQYQKAVWKSRLTQLSITTNAYQKAFNLYILSHGLPTDEEETILFTGDNATASLDIDVACSAENDTYCVTPYANIDALCGNWGCMVEFVKVFGNTNDAFTVYFNPWGAIDEVDTTLGLGNAAFRKTACAWVLDKYGIDLLTEDTVRICGQAGVAGFENEGE